MRVWPVLRAVGAIGTGAVLVIVVASASRSDTSTPQQDAAPAIAPYQAPRDLDTGALRGPVQPIFFRHDLHAGQYQMDCQYCHAYVEISPNPGLPSTATCMGCHQIVGAQLPEVQKLRDAASSNTPIEWVEVHETRQFVHFPHHRHVVAGGLDCTTCHGDVARMARVYQFASLKMGWCVSCHERSTYADQPERPVTTDCTACHY